MFWPRVRAFRLGSSKELFHIRDSPSFGDNPGFDPDLMRTSKYQVHQIKVPVRHSVYMCGVSEGDITLFVAVPESLYRDMPFILRNGDTNVY